MNRIIILIKTFLFTLPFFALGYVFQFFFRLAPSYLLLIVFIFAIGGCIFFIVSSNKKFRIKNPKIEMPDYLQMSNIIYVLIGGIIAYYLTASLFRTVLYIDNGTNKIVKIEIPNNEEFELLPNNYKQTSVPISENTKVFIDGKPKELKITNEGNWVYNIQNLNRYVETNVDYVNATTMYNSSKADSLLNDKTESKKEFKILEGELFITKASYLFDPPSEITTNSKVTDKKMTVSVLYRLPKK